MALEFRPSSDGFGGFLVLRISCHFAGYSGRGVLAPESAASPDSADNRSHFGGQRAPRFRSTGRAHTDSNHRVDCARFLRTRHDSQCLARIFSN